MLPVSTIRRLLVAALLVFVVLAAPEPASAARIDPVDTWVVKHVDVWATHLIYEPTRDVFLASVAPVHPSLGNELVEIDPETGAIGRHVIVGSYPIRIAASDDGAMAYVGLLGANSITQVDLATFTVVRKFRTAPDTEQDMFVEDLDVPPGRSDVVVASLQTKNSSPKHAGVWAYDDGVVLPSHTDGHTGANLIEAATASTVYGYTTESSGFAFWTFTLDAQGVHHESDAQIVQGNLDIELAGSMIATSNRQLIDPSVPEVVRTYGDVGYGVVEPTVDDDRVTFLENFTDGLLEQYKLSTGQFIGSRTFPEFIGAKDIVASAKGFAVRMGGSFYLVGSAVTPGPVVIPPPAPSTMTTLIETAVPVTAIDLAFDPKRNLVYASVPNHSASHANEIVAIDPRTSAITRSLHVGSDPFEIAISDDQSRLYVALQATNKIVRVDLATFTEVGRFSTGVVGPDVVYAEDIEVQPGRPDTVAVTLMKKGSSPRFAGLAIYKNGQRLADMATGHQGPNRVEFASANTLFAAMTESSGGLSVYTFNVDATGVHQLSLHGNSGGALDFELAGGLGWTNMGNVFDPVQHSAVAELDRDHGAIEPRPGLKRIYQLNYYGTLAEYELPAYRLIAYRQLNTEGTMRVLISTATGFAAVTNAGVTLLNQPMCNGRLATVIGGSSTIAGTTGNDVIVGTSGNDVIDGRAGNDVICGGGGNDTMRGSAGDDHLYGGAGSDRLHGGGGFDLCAGGLGTDEDYLCEVVVG